jgi:hypothetical protein
VVSTFDTDTSGVIVWGRCRYTPGGVGPFDDVYEVQRPDGLYFLAKQAEIRPEK